MQAPSRFKVYLGEQLVKALAQEAAVHRCTVSAEIRARLIETFEAEGINVDKRILEVGHLKGEPLIGQLPPPKIEMWFGYLSGLLSKAVEKTGNTMSREVRVRLIRSLEADGYQI